MAANLEEITKEIVGLPRHQRLALAKLLLDLGRTCPVALRGGQSPTVAR